MAFQANDTVTLIAREAEIIGDLKFSGELEVQGVVRGNIIAKGEKAATVRVVEGGRVEGEIRAPHVIINGQVSGDVFSSEHVELAAKAQVQGNVQYHLIEMVKGAQLNGSLIYGGQAPNVKSIGKGAEALAGK